MIILNYHSEIYIYIGQGPENNLLALTGDQLSLF